jgi:tetratricopeptide (TPR) repeat protein
MWRLKFPLFALKLASNYLLTLAHLVVFQLRINKLVIANITLTALLLLLAAGLVWIPSAKPEPSPDLAINLDQSKEVIPLYRTVKTKQLVEIFEEYRQDVAAKTIVPQADYVNLAILAHAAGRYETAGEYLQLAIYINPNRDFFVY